MYIPRRKTTFTTNLLHVPKKARVRRNPINDGNMRTPNRSVTPIAPGVNDREYRCPVKVHAPFTQNPYPTLITDTTSTPATPCMDSTVFSNSYRSVSSGITRTLIRLIPKPICSTCVPIPFRGGGLQFLFVSPQYGPVPLRKPSVQPQSRFLIIRVSRRLNAHDHTQT